MNLAALRRRAELLDRLRTFFRERGFLEVETPLVAAEAIPERHIELFELAGGDGLLQASPEMHHKRLLCAGSGPIFEVTRSFRTRERGPLHRPEFTLVEWYRPGDDAAAGMALLDELMRELLATPKASRTTYREAFERTLGVDPHAASVAELAAVAAARSSEPAWLPPADDRDEWLNYLLATHVEPTLGAEGPELLHRYPASQAALATTAIDASGAEVAERFELYWRGVELANGYEELTDAAELRERLAGVNVARADAGLPAVPMPEALLADMGRRGLPACSGVALGFDRLAMLAVGAESLGEVVPFSNP